MNQKYTNRNIRKRMLAIPIPTNNLNTAVRRFSWRASSRYFLLRWERSDALDSKTIKELFFCQIKFTVKCFATMNNVLNIRNHNPCNILQLIINRCYCTASLVSVFFLCSLDITVLNKNILIQLFFYKPNSRKWYGRVVEPTCVAYWFRNSVAISSK